MAKHTYLREPSLVSILEEALTNISALDIELFLYYDSDYAIKLVSEHVESQN
jgi:hypothetical protein